MLVTQYDVKILKINDVDSLCCSYIIYRFNCENN